MFEEIKNANQLKEAFEHVSKQDLRETLLQLPDDFFKEHTSFQNGREFLEAIPLERLSAADKDRLVREHTPYENYEAFKSKIFAVAVAKATMVVVKEAVKVQKEKEEKRMPDFFLYLNALLIISIIKGISLMNWVTAENEQLLFKATIIGLILFAINRWIAQYDKQVKKALLFILVLLSVTLVLFKSF